MSELPPEIWLLITGFLSPTQLWALRGTSYFWWQEAETLFRERFISTDNIEVATQLVTRGYQRVQLRYLGALPPTTWPAVHTIYWWDEPHFPDILPCDTLIVEGQNIEKLPLGCRELQLRRCRLEEDKIFHLMDYEKVALEECLLPEETELATYRGSKLNDLEIVLHKEAPSEVSIFGPDRIHVRTSSPPQKSLQVQVSGQNITLEKTLCALGEASLTINWPEEIEDEEQDWEIEECVATNILVTRYTGRASGSLYCTKLWINTFRDDPGLDCDHIYLLPGLLPKYELPYHPKPQIKSVFCLHPDNPEVRQSFPNATISTYDPAENPFRGHYI